MGGQGREGLSPIPLPSELFPSLLTFPRRQSQTIKSAEKRKEGARRRGARVPGETARGREGEQGDGGEGEEGRAAERGAAGDQEEWEEVKIRDRPG